MLQLVIVVLLAVVLVFVFKGRKIESPAGSFNGEIVFVALCGILIGALAIVTPTLLPYASSFAENVLKAEYEGVSVGTGKVVGTKTGTSVSVSVNGSAASAQAQVAQSNLPSNEGAQLMAQLKSKITVNGRTVSGFQDPGNGWKWFVIDTSISSDRGQTVQAEQYVFQDANVRQFTFYLAKDKGNGMWEFGPKEVINLP